MDQVKTVTKWIKKIKTPRRKRANKDKNKTYPLSSSSTRRKIKSRSKTTGVCQSKNILHNFEDDLHKMRIQEETTDYQVEEKKTLKQVIKNFLSPSKNRSTEKKNKNIKQLNEDSKSSKAPEHRQIVNFSTSSLLIVGNFRTSSPVRNRKTLDEYATDFRELENKQYYFSVNDNIGTHTFIPAGGRAQDGDSNNELPGTPNDLIRSNSDSEILPLVDSRSSDEEFSDFTRSDILRHSYPGPCNSTRRESCQRMLRCMLENMAYNMFDDQFNQLTIQEDDTLDSEIQRCFDSFDESITSSPDVSVMPKKTMKETLLEISSRRQSMINKEKIFCPMKSPTRKNNGSDYWKLKRSGNISYVISPRNLLSITGLNISEENEDQINEEMEKDIITNNVRVNNDNKTSDSTPHRRACFEDSYYYDSDDSLVLGTWI